MRQEIGELRDECDQKQSDQKRKDQRKQILENAGKRGVADFRTGECAQTHGRRAKTDGEVDDHDHSEVVGVDVIAGGEGNEQRRKDKPA